MAWAPGVLNPDTCKYEGEKLWTSGTSYPCVDTDCEVDIVRLDGDTGAVDAKITITGLSGVNLVTGAGSLTPELDAIRATGYGAYGGAADGDGNFWILIGNTTQLIRVDHATLEHEIWKIPNHNGYGITVDAKGRVFLCGMQGVTRFDYTTAAFMEQPAVQVGYAGCMTDGVGTLWTGGEGLTAVDTETLAIKQNIPVLTGAKGVSIDFDGNVWAVQSKGFTAARIDPVTLKVDAYHGLFGAYTYSDMTGFGLRQAGTAKRPD